MKTTYLVETKIQEGHDILEYSETLNYAKQCISNFEKLGYQHLSILCIEGDRFGEGFHQYRLLKIHSPDGEKFYWKRLKHSHEIKNY